LREVPSDELHVYLLLCDFAGKSDYCWPSDRTIGGFIGKSRYTVQKLLSRLEERKLISRAAVEPTPDNPTGRVITLHNRVRPRVAPAPQADKRTAAPAPQGVLRGHPGGVAHGVADPVAPARHELYKEEKKQYGPAAGKESPPARTEQEEKAREAVLRTAWAGLAEPVQAEIHAAVAAANPSLARWPKMMEPLCLAEMEARLARGKTLTPTERTSTHSDGSPSVLRVVGGLPENFFRNL
jgi:hypothetical protein